LAICARLVFAAAVRARAGLSAGRAARIMGGVRAVAPLAGGWCVAPRAAGANSRHCR